MLNISANPLTTALACSPAATAQRALKMHLHLLRTARAEYRVLTLRPGIDVQFASNYYHSTWHFLTDHIGASVLARLWWALSFDRNSNVLIVIDGATLALGRGRQEHFLDDLRQRRGLALDARYGFG